jgi:hypothetical protein
MKQDGKFVLLGLNEFETWLAEKKITRLIKLIQTHHTYSPNYNDFNEKNHFQLLQGMEYYHVHNNGFSEIAQNLTTFPDGAIAVCRDLNTIPAGIKGANQFGICIEHLGNFDGKDSLTSEHQATIIGLTTLLCRRFNLQPSTDTIVYHHWYDLADGERKNGAGVTKTCPGTMFFGGNTVEAAREGFIPLIKI